VSQEPQPREDAGAFARSRALFEQLVAELADPACDRLTHGQLEEKVARGVGDVLRVLAEEHRGAHPAGPTPAA
jgi:hypothetical protein